MTNNRNTIFTKRVLKTKGKINTYFLLVYETFKKNYLWFLFSTFITILLTLINFNVNMNSRVLSVISSNYSKSADLSTLSLWDVKDFSFGFNIFGLKFEKINLGFKSYLILSVILSLVIRSFFSVISYYLISYAWDKAEKDIKQDIFGYITRSKFANSCKVSDVLFTSTITEAANIANFIWLIPNKLISSCFSVFLLITWGLGGSNLSLLIFTVVGLFAIFVFGVIIVLFKKASMYNIVANKSLEEDKRLILDRIKNLQQIKLLSVEEKEIEFINNRLDRTFNKNKKSLLFSVFFKAIPNWVIINNSSLIVLLILALLNTNSFFTKTFNNPLLLVNFFNVYETIKNLTKEITKITEFLIEADHVLSVISVLKDNINYLESEKQISNKNTIKLDNLKGDIVFKNVDFKYYEKANKVLSNFNFRFKEGLSYGIIGKNGMGKSTITKTLMRLYNLNRGTIEIRNSDISKLDIHFLRTRICYQSNNFAFYHGNTIANFVFLPDELDKYSEQKLIFAAKKTGIYDFINQLPNKFNTKIEAGLSFSEGQKQQISAMRIFIKDYDVYILDEILSNVHPELRTIIVSNIFSFLKNKTIIVIDHHYDIFNHVDKILLFSNKGDLIEKEKSFLNEESQDK